MKIKNFKTIIIFILLITFMYNHNTFAGACTHKRIKCRSAWPQYVAEAVIVSATLLGIPWISRRSSCYQSITNSLSVFNAYAFAQIGDGLTTRREHCSKWYAATGMPYGFLYNAPYDSLGFSDGISSENTVFDSANHQIIINNFSGYISSALNSNFGSTLLYVVWIPSNENDLIINASEVLTKGKVSIEFGQFETSGIFDSTDFNVVNILDTASGQIVKRVVFKQNIEKIIPISNSISLDSITVSIFTEGGYGVFIENELINPYMNMDLKLINEGFLNSSFNTLNKKDSVKVFLRNINFPYTIVDSGKANIDSVNFTGNFDFLNAPTGKYYIQLKHRNSIETWSKVGGDSLKRGITNFYDFTSSTSQAYSNNLILKGSKWCIYSGDVTQDGIIDAGDLSQVENDASYGLNGYVNSDVTGDDFVDAEDLSIVENNTAMGISVITP